MWDEYVHDAGGFFGGDPPLIDVPIHTVFVGGTIPPTDPLHEGHMEYAYFSARTATFSRSVALTDLSDFAGAGSNDFTVATYAGFDENLLSGTVTETIATSATPPPLPEPSVWMMMTAGLGLAGAALRGRARRRVGAAAGVFRE